MLVTTYRDGTAHTGLLVGEADARRYFPNREGAIELQLDGLEIQCALEPDFWKGRPRISDPRLSVWLEFKVGRGRFGRHPMVMSLVPAGAGKFVLRPEATPVFPAFGADIALLPQPESGVFDSLELESRSVA